MMLRYWARLYLNQTAAEKALEPAIAALGVPYRAQHPFFQFKLIADFALIDDKLVIEVDGESHNRPAQIKKDLEHMIALKSLGWDVVRVRNEDATARPAETVRAALTAPRKALPELQEALAQHLQRHPELLVPRAKSPRKRKSRRRATRAE